jgi:ribonuclease P protein component
LDNRHTFRKEERISGQKEIDSLFGQGISFISYPLRIVYVEKELNPAVPASVLVSVPKKKFKRAVKRNRLKRLIRESYRLHKTPFLECLEEKDRGLLVGFLFVGKEMTGFKEIEAAVTKALNILMEKMP